MDGVAALREMRLRRRSFRTLARSFDSVAAWTRPTNATIEKQRKSHWPVGFDQLMACARDVFEPVLSQKK
jgi:hypothetical protein